MGQRSQTIEIFLPDGEPRGLRIAGITTRIVQAVQCPRTKLDRLFARPESQRVSLYFLFGLSDEGAKPQVYIGQTEDLVTRLKSHHSNKDFWNTVVAVTARTESFTQVHVRYLEWLSIDRAKSVDRYRVENGNAGGRPYIPEPLEADVQDAFETAMTLVATLGFPIFESLSKQKVERELFYCKATDADGRGFMSDEGFVLLKGSVCRPEMRPAATTYLGARDELQNAGVLVRRDDGTLELVEDYLCSSVSQAGTLVLGINTNGWTAWKNKDGRTLHDQYRDSN